MNDLETKLAQEPTFGPDPVNTLWRAFEQIQQVPTEHTENTKATSGTLSSVCSVYSVGKESGGRFALEPQSVLEPFAQRGARADPEKKS